MGLKSDVGGSNPEVVQLSLKLIGDNQKLLYLFFFLKLFLEQPQNYTSKHCFDHNSKRTIYRTVLEDGYEHIFL